MTQEHVFSQPLQIHDDLLCYSSRMCVQRKSTTSLSRHALTAPNSRTMKDMPSRRNCRGDLEMETVIITNLKYFYEGKYQIIISVERRSLLKTALKSIQDILILNDNYRRTLTQQYFQSISSSTRYLFIFTRKRIIILIDYET